MCLDYTLFSLKSKSRPWRTWFSSEPCGIGYRAASHHKPLNRWLTANYSKLPRMIASETNHEDKYWPGFHIFTNLEDAIKYSLGEGICKVLYKKVVAFGKQELFRFNDILFSDTDIYTNRLADCVIAHKIRYVHHYNDRNMQKCYHFLRQKEIKSVLQGKPLPEIMGEVYSQADF